MKKTNRRSIIITLLFAEMLLGCLFMSGCSGFPGTKKFKEPQPVISRNDSTHAIESMNISSDGTLLAVGYSPIILGSSERNLAAYQQASFNGTGASNNAVYSSSTIASQPILRIWALDKEESPQLLGTQPINNLRVHTPKFSRDNQSIFVAEHNGILQILLNELFVWRESLKNGTSTSQTPDMYLLPNTVVQKAYECEEPIQLLSRHGRLATIVSPEGECSILNIRSKTVRFQLFGDIDRVLAFSDTGQFIAVRERMSTDLPRGNERIAVWSIPSKSSQDGVAKVSQIDIEYFASEELCRFSPDGTTLAMVLRPRTLGLWNVRSGKLISELNHDNSIRGFAFSPTEKQIIVCTAESGKGAQLTLWDTNKNNILQTQNDKTTDEITAVVFDPDGKSFFTGDRNGNIKRWLVRGKK